MHKPRVCLALALLFVASHCQSVEDFHARQRRSNIPCGRSFTPCFKSPLARGVATNTVSLSEDEDEVSEPGAGSIPSDGADRVKPIIPKEVLLKVIREAMTEVEKVFNEIEKNMFKKINARNPSPSEDIWSSFTSIDKYAKDLSFSSLVSIQSTQHLRTMGMTNERTALNLPLMEIDGSKLAEICPKDLITECSLTKYRTISGHCNNINRPLQGAVYEPFQRFVNPDYSDGISTARRSGNGGMLPSARKISRMLITEGTEKHSVCTAMLAQWAMFVHEDLAQIGTDQLFDGNESKPLPCCEPNFSHPECLPIEIENEDPVYSRKCIPYSRSITAPRENCSLGPREQGNEGTSYLDASHIYGSKKERAKQLRLFKDGLLDSKAISQGKELLPGKKNTLCERASSASPLCLLTGSDISSLTIGSIGLHTIWLRQHNTVANQLKVINPHWDDEKLYQESRAIVAAQIQHITYNEFLPIIIGIDNLSRYGLNLNTYAYDSDYDLHEDATTLNEYASAAGLFFFSLFPNERSLYGDQNSRGGPRPHSVDILSLFNQGKLDLVIRSLLEKPITKPGLHINEEYKNHFLKGQGKQGIDLAAHIIQMGRDHGLPSYTTFRSSCGLRRPSNFSDLDDIVLPSVDIKILSTSYENIDDVDLFVLGLAEKPEPGSLIGPTFACIIGKQFQRTRHGDRYWYENFFQPSALTLNQLNEIRKTTLARIICDNADDIRTIQTNVFSLADNFGNCPVKCNSSLLEKVNLNHWADQEPKIKLPITRATIEKALRLGAEHAKQFNDAERARIDNANRFKQTDIAVSSHSSLMAPKRQSLRISQTSAILREATRVLIRGEGLREDERLPSELDLNTLQRLLPEIDVKKIVGSISGYVGREGSGQDECLPKPLPCDHTTKYRTFTGWCNNLKFPHYGNAFSPMRRLLDPVYDDGFDSPRMTARSGKMLPSARAISNAVHAEAPVFHVKYTHMLMQMGQLLDHDFAHSPVARGPGNTLLDCSRCDSHKTVSVHCFPIPVDRNDPHFKSKNNQPKCIPFVRSLLGQLTLGYRNQLDQLTSFIDASFLYGSTDCEANSLRYFSQGRMNFTNLGFNTEALPQGSQEKDCRTTPRHPCFNAGDARNNEQPGLTVMHTIFLREHNRIASTLYRINSLWSDDKIYQETRRIMGAKMQHIVYNEWLPVVLGCETAAKYDLIPKKTGYYTGYDGLCDATFSQEMATAAFRFGHTLIRNSFPRMNGRYEQEAVPLQLKDSFGNTSFYYNEAAGHIESVLFGLLGVNSMAFDRHISNAVRNHLFQKAGNDTSGMDLPALNIQRARDHGVPPYNYYRELCGLKKARNFEDLSDVMNQTAYLALKSVYEHVDDIDLFPGLMSETSMKGAVVGPTLGCILAEQFQRLKRCDRFYYENDDAATRFTPGQLAQIRKTKLSKLICENSEYARRIQPNAFLIPDDLTNAPVKCSELPSMDLYEWLDRQFCLVDRKVIDIGKTKRITPCVTCTCTAEGPECHSVIVDQCSTLLDEFVFSEIAADTVCVIQCASLIKQRNGRL